MSGSTWARKYSWLKSPRYDGEPMEDGGAAGPDAGGLRIGPHGREERRGSGPEEARCGAGGALLDARTHCRACDRTRLLAEKMGDWVEELSGNMGKGDLRIHDNSKWDPSTWPKEARGAGFHEAPRGALGHWVGISSGAISHTSASSPAPGTRDRATLGASADLTRTILGTPVANPEQPLEILPTVQSSIPAWPAASTCSIRRGRELARVRVR